MGILIILLEQLLPMNTKPILAKTISATQIKYGESQSLLDLRRALILNRQTQEKLKYSRDFIHTRMKLIEESISSIRLKTEFPPATGLISYIKFQRNMPASFKQQARITECLTQGKVKADEDSEFMKKLQQAKSQKKRRELSFKELPHDPKKIDFLQIQKETQFKNGLDAYRAWIDQWKVKDPKRLFTLSEDKLIDARHQMYGENWEKICQIIENRSVDDVYYEYHNRINPSLATGRWTVRQTLMLIILLQHFGPKRWALIAQKMVVKSELQVRERYCNLVDPTIGKDVWTFDLEKRLLQIAEQYNFCWKKISEIPIFKNKTDNCIWRKFKMLMIRFTQEQIRQILPPQKCSRNLAQKIIKEKRIFESRKRAAKNKPQPPIYFNQYKPKTVLKASAAEIQKAKNGQIPVTQASVGADGPKSGIMREIEQQVHFIECSESEQFQIYQRDD